MGRAIVNRGTPQAVVIPKTAEVGGRAIVNRGNPNPFIAPPAPIPSRGIVNRSSFRPDTPLAATPEPKQIV